MSAHVIILVKPGTKVSYIETDNVEKPTLIDAAALKPSKRPIKMGFPSPMFGSIPLGTASPVRGSLFI